MHSNVLNWKKSSHQLPLILEFPENWGMLNTVEKRWVFIVGFWWWLVCNGYWIGYHLWIMEYLNLTWGRSINFMRGLMGTFYVFLGDTWKPMYEICTSFFCKVNFTRHFFFCILKKGILAGKKLLCKGNFSIKFPPPIHPVHLHEVFQRQDDQLQTI